MNSQPAQIVPPPLEYDLAVIVASDAHCIHAEAICDQIHESAFARGTGIARRSISYIQNKMRTGHAIIALTHENEVAGFCYIETWGHDQFVANSGLIVFPQFRNHGLASAIKSAAFELSRAKYPKAKLFGLTTNQTVMNINSDLGYRPVTFAQLTADDAFWSSCQSCVNYPILQSKQRKNCLCTAMLFDPERAKK